VNAEQVKSALYARHPGYGGQMPGPWTCIEEYRGIDLLAFSAWSSQGGYARVGYEVKISRGDLRRELLKPHKRSQAVAWCHEFYFAVPAGMLTAAELAWKEPVWADEDWNGERCPGFAGQTCTPKRWRNKTHHVYLPKPSTSRWDSHEYIVCPTCQGKGELTPSRVLREAPTCWIPSDVGLVTVDGRGTKIVRPSPKRKEVPALDHMEVGQMVRCISMRPDPRHHPVTRA